jgi:hypothetical protein
MDEVKLSDEFLITKEFHTATDFSLYVELRAINEGMTCLEVIVDYCEKKDIDTSAIAGLITPSLREKLRMEGESLKLLKRTSEKLPL